MQLKRKFTGREKERGKEMILVNWEEDAKVIVKNFSRKEMDRLNAIIAMDIMVRNMNKNLLILHGFILYLIVQMNMILLTSRKMRKELKRIRCLMQQLLYSKSCGDNTQAKRMVYILATRHTET